MTMWSVEMRHLKEAHPNFPLASRDYSFKHKDWAKYKKGGEKRGVKLITPQPPSEIPKKKELWSAFNYEPLKYEGESRLGPPDCTIHSGMEESWKNLPRDFEWKGSSFYRQLGEFEQKEGSERIEPFVSIVAAAKEAVLYGDDGSIFPAEIRQMIWEMHPFYAIDPDTFEERNQKLFDERLEIKTARLMDDGQTDFREQYNNLVIKWIVFYYYFIYLKEFQCAPFCVIAPCYYFESL